MSHDTGDPSDPEFIAQELSYLRQKLSRRYRHIDEHLLDASIEDALLYYRRNPHCFDASRGVPLSSYMELWARSYLFRLLRREKRHRRHQKAAGVSERNFEKILSEVRAERSIYTGRDRSGQEAEEREEELDRQRGVVNAIVAQLNPRDRAGVRLLLDGASFEEWVRHLGIEHLPRKEQQHKVNGEKDRLMKYLKRRAQKMQGGGVEIGSEPEFG